MRVVGLPAIAIVASLAVSPAPQLITSSSRFFRISGTIVDSRGQRAVRPRVVALRREGRSRQVQNSASTDAQGRFVIAPLPAGEYRLGVLNLSAVLGIPHEFATAAVQIHNADVSNLVIVTAPGVSVSGALKYDPAPSEPVQASVTIHPADRFAATYSIQFSQTVRGTAFTLDDLFGPALVRATADGWSLKAVLLRGRDITDVPTQFSAKDAGQLTIVMTTQAPSIEGTVRDAAGSPAHDAVVMLFGEDRTTWIPQSSMLRFALTNPEGRFRIGGLREGRYFAVAVPRDLAPSPVEPDARAFEALTAGAVRLALGAAETPRLTLELFVPPHAD